MSIPQSKSDVGSLRIPVAPRVSFVIPALNEAAFVSSVINAIQTYCPEPLAYEIVLVDNGSTDGTPEIAMKAGANVVLSASGNVGSLRNVGANAARGQVLVFLDADVLLTSDWEQNFPRAFELVSESRLLTGSWVRVRDQQSSWIERDWFGRMQEARHSHMNSGHCIIGAAFFCELGGFDESLRSGEDVDLSDRVIQAGGRIEEIPSLRVIHLGYPRDLRNFFVREIWHGSGDYATVARWLGSNVAIASSILSLSIIAGLLWLLFFQDYRPIAAAIAMLALASVSSAFIKLRPRSFGQWLRASILFMAYFVARGLAFFYRDRTRARIAARN